MQVLVRDNNIDQALRVLKKKMQREGVFREMKRRRFYEKPSEQAPSPQACSQAGGAGRTDCRAEKKASTASQRRRSAPVASKS
jgi:small subunit ribosomal protein S21